MRCTQVNTTDADRDGIEDYLDGLEALNEKKGEMIDNVREALGVWKDMRVRAERARDNERRQKTLRDEVPVAAVGGRQQQRRMSASKWLEDAGGEDEEDDDDDDDLR